MLPHWSFAYNADGMRTQRTNGSDTWTYIYNGSQLTQMTRGNDTLHFTYDANGAPMTVTHNGTRYYYLTNIQGDVIGLCNRNTIPVVSYSYDAWGKLLDVEHTAGGQAIANLNPLRYRGYIYDAETELYYLQSRYYDPEIGRFINADGFVSTGQGVLGNNMFVYCGNSPVDNMDDTGTRHCAATTAANESVYDRSYSAYWQKQVLLEMYNPEPIGRYSGGNVYLVTDVNDVYTDFSGDVVIVDNRDCDDEMLCRVQIRNSVLIKDKQAQRQILSLLDQYEVSNPSKWNRNSDIEDMVIEWDAHNDIFALWANYRCQHVDIDNKDKGVPYIAYWWRAIHETIF